MFIDIGAGPTLRQRRADPSRGVGSVRLSHAVRGRPGSGAARPSRDRADVDGARARRRSRRARSSSVAIRRATTSSSTIRTCRATTPRSAQPAQLIDHGSTSGTWLGQERIAPGQPRPLDAHALVALRPGAGHGAARLPARPGARRRAGRHARSRSTPPVPRRRCWPAPARRRGPAKPKHKTVIGQVQLGEPRRRASRASAARRTTTSSSRTRRSRANTRSCTRSAASSSSRTAAAPTAPTCAASASRPGSASRSRTAKRSSSARCRCCSQVQDESVAVVVEDVAQWAGRPLYEIEAWDLVLQVPDRDNPGQMKTLLDHVSFKALPGDLIALMGPSGAGKTTLLLTLNGYLPPSAGQVRINGEDLYADLRRAARLDRLRAAGRHRAPRAHGVRGRALQREVPPAARLLRRRDRPPRRDHARAARPGERRAPADRPAGKEDPVAAVSASASTSRWSW